MSKMTLEAADVPEPWLLCKRCAVQGVSMPAAFTVPAGPPRFEPVLACVDHAAPYKSKKRLTPAPKA
jgi:hypothetical protein